MTKQENDYQCVPPERVAQLLSLGSGYEGYIEFQNGHKIFVEILPNDNVTINQQYTPQNEILSVYITHPNNPLLVETEKHWSAQELKSVQLTNGVVGLTTGTVENFSPEGTMRFTKGDKFSPQYYKNGWQGGSPAKIKTYKVVTDKMKSGARTVGRSCFYIGIPIEIALVATGEQSLIKSSVNITFSAIGVWGGPPGWIISGLYFGLDLVGAFDGPAHIIPAPKDSMERYTHPADATCVERVCPIDPIPQQKTQYTPSEQPIVKQGYKK